MSTALIGIRAGLTPEQLIEIDELIETLEPEAKEIVEHQPTIETTRAHYGYYMGIFSKVCPDDKLAATFLANALARAGGNRQGIIDGLRVAY